MLINTRFALLCTLFVVQLFLAACVATPPTAPVSTTSSDSVDASARVVGLVATPHADSLAAPSPSTEIQYLTQAIPPCTPISGSSVDPCEPDVKIQTDPLVVAASGGIFRYDQPQTVREFLDEPITYIPHLVLRGTYIPDTARCTSGNQNHVPSYAEPGYFQNSILFQCFADVRVNSYILGSGPAQLTVQVSFHHYWEGYYAEDAANLGMTEQELIEQFVEIFAVILEEGYKRTGQGIYGREVVLFVGPAHSQAVEVWEVFETWDLQRQDDGAVVAVHPQRDEWRAARPDDYQNFRSQLEMELPAFTQAVTTAHQARVAENGGRIAPANIQSRAEGVELPMFETDANNLRQFYTDTGAYDHPDGPPAPPPPPCGMAVPNQTNNPGLMRDCMTLLGFKDSLRGTATLNWSVDTPISEWDGIRVQGSPSRVRQVILVQKNLDGTLPPELGSLDALERLWLGYNQLTGEIPTSLGNLDNLNSLTLNHNRLTGSVPTELGGLSEMEAIWLSANRLSGEIPASLGNLSNLKQLTIADNRLSGSIPSVLGTLSNLEVLQLNYNQLTGEIPPSLASISSLEDLLLGDNRLTGCIPRALRDVANHDLDRTNLQDCAPTP